jgi:parvulin-like peptidyl-prolyl isomerase
MRLKASGWTVVGGLALAAAALCGGCATTTSFYNRLVGNTQPQQVSPDQFVQPQQPPPTGPVAVDQPGGLNADNPRLSATYRPTLPPLPAPTANAKPPLDPTLTNAEPPLAVAATTQPGEIEPATQPAAAATTLPTTSLAQAPQGQAPATSEPNAYPGLSSGQYMPLGGVVEEVNGTPIYLNKLLQLIWPSLKNDAAQMDADHFALAAHDLVERQRGALERDEVFFAAAQRTLDDSDKKLVTALTGAYRQKQITDAGGSVEVARRTAAANGDNFDEKVQDQYRQYMIDLYNQRKFSPQLQPSAAELRRYYDEHRDADFITDRPQADFDLLGINPAALGGQTEEENRKLAFDKAKQAHDRAAAGESFTTLFNEFNNDPGLVGLTNGTGDVGSIQRGSFNIKEIEDAVWNLQPGAVTDVLELNGELYLAKMVSRKEGSVKPFDDEDVQTKITELIKAERFNQLEAQELDRLSHEAVIEKDHTDEMEQTAVDMALQNYYQWNKK